jgi:hypothetical protein
MTITAKPRVVEAVNAVMRDLVYATHRPEGSYVKLPIFYPSGSEVVVRVSGGPDRFYITDFGMGFVEAEFVGAERIYVRHAKQIGLSAGVGFDDHAFFAIEIDRDQLLGGIATIANCSAEAMIITALKSAEKVATDHAEFMIDKLERVFGTDKVRRNEKIIGSSNHEWEFAASILNGRRRSVFEFATKHAQSIASVAMKMDDVSRLNGAPNRIVMVRDKKEMGTYLGVLAHSSNIVEEKISDEKIRKLASAE